MMHDYTELRLSMRIGFPVRMRLIDVNPDDPRLISEVLPVLLELRPHLTPEAFVRIYDEGHPQGLRFLAAYDGAHCVGVAGWRILASTHTVRKLYVDDLVTTESARSGGVGRALLTELGQRASAAGCTVLDLDSGTHRTRAHAFYFREGLHISSFHFVRAVDSS
jgi:GNAT superfamily N-acetyltransferase